ncbi:hypothetical protein AMTR_s00017p00148040 [Amborella trichopoda]|uniref:Uncharacterized protein n=1 Tax=Amborella trichopoda TaxID=13333 RepID=W1PN37_AMBTC|nr:hypothetical protein AMTR_s00017p00148040 [Amborella trichopoda]
MRITIKEIKSHPWFLKNLPRELTEVAQVTFYQHDNRSLFFQSVEEIMKDCGGGEGTAPFLKIGRWVWVGPDEEDDAEDDEEYEEDDGEEDEYDKRVK